MKILKTLGFVLLAVIALALIIGAILPTHLEYERSADINAPKEVIFAKLNDLKTWEDWGPWKEEEPTWEVTYAEKTKGVGASYSWTAESGEGTMTIIESTAPTFQKTALVFDGEEGGNGWFKLEDGENGATKTIWGFGMDIPYPFNSMMLFNGGSMEEMMNNMFDTGLANLKELCEKEASAKTYRGFAIKSMDFPGKSYLAIRETVNMGDMGAFFANSYGAIMAAVGKNKLEMDGMPSGIYYSWDEENQKSDMAAAIPVKGGADAASGSIQHLEIPEGKCVTIDYFGSYEGAGEAHYAMDDYFKENGLEPSTLVMEEYITDPSSEPDTSKWHTKIHYFIGGPLASEE